MKKTKPPVNTKIGIFEWRGIHSKWCCDNSTLEGEITINIDSHEILESELDEVIRIFEEAPALFRASMKKAKRELREYGAAPDDMTLSGIGLSDLLYPNGFAVTYRYPESIWPDGELTVVYRKNKPDYCHSDD
ncbi:hypothetical protein JIN77_02165 [Verrucomicrobiaceae bacterium R5-34]|nr:hypothetical protein [Verrucomicrobiaceae bacterium R5-34]